MKIELTKDADKMICYLYKEYLTRHKNEMSKSSARQFEDNYFRTAEKFSSWNYSDIQMSLSELKSNELVKDNITGSFQLSDKCIIYMENRFKAGLNELADFISKFIP